MRRRLTAGHMVYSKQTSAHVTTFFEVADKAYLPTVVGLWDGTDLEEQQRLDLSPNVEGTEAMRDRLAERGELSAGASTADAVLAAHRLLGRTPCLLRCATLDDALAVAARPNVPGADDRRPNWSLPLPEPVEALERSDLAAAIARALAR